MEVVCKAKNVKNIIKSGVTYVDKRLIVRNNAHLQPKTIEFTPTPITTPTPTPTHTCFIW